MAWMYGSGEYRSVWRGCTEVGYSGAIVGGLVVCGKGGGGVEFNMAGKYGGGWVGNGDGDGGAEVIMAGSGEGGGGGGGEGEGWCTPGSTRPVYTGCSAHAV